MPKVLDRLPGVLETQAVYWFSLFLWFMFILLISRANNNAERIFALMPEKNEHSYCTMIRGMVKVYLFYFLLYLRSTKSEFFNLTAIKLSALSQKHLEPEVGFRLRIWGICVYIMRGVGNFQHKTCLNFIYITHQAKIILYHKARVEFFHLAALYHCSVLSHFVPFQILQFLD